MMVNGTTQLAITREIHIQRGHLSIQRVQFRIRQRMPVTTRAGHKITITFRRQTNGFHRVANTKTRTVSRLAGRTRDHHPLRAKPVVVRQKVSQRK